MHIIKLAVGITTFDQLFERQLKRYRENKECIHKTRLFPRKLVFKKGSTSIFWVIKGNVQARQEIKAIIESKKDISNYSCHLVLSEKVIPTEIVPHRPFRGWRYIKDVPKDIEMNRRDSRYIYLILKELCLI